MRIWVPRESVRTGKGREVCDPRPGREWPQQELGPGDGGGARGGNGRGARKRMLSEGARGGARCHDVESMGVVVGESRAYCRPEAWRAGEVTSGVSRGAGEIASRCRGRTHVTIIVVEASASRRCRARDWGFQQGNRSVIGVEGKERERERAG